MESLEKAGMKAIFIGADTATPENFIVSQPLLIGKDNHYFSPDIGH